MPVIIVIDVGDGVSLLLRGAGRSMQGRYVALHGVSGPGPACQVYLCLSVVHTSATYAFH